MKFAFRTCSENQINQAYTSVLATFNVFSLARVSHIYSFHLTTVTLAVCALYAYRDIWPLLTFTLRPIDEVEGGLLWAKVALIVFISIVEPLFEPYPYVPVDPEVRFTRSISFVI